MCCLGAPRHSGTPSHRALPKKGTITSIMNLRHAGAFALIMACVLHTSGCSAQPEAVSKQPIVVYDYAFAREQGPKVELGGVAKPAKDWKVDKIREGILITLKSAGTWRCNWSVGEEAIFLPKLQLLGDETVRVAYTYAPPDTCKVPDEVTMAIQLEGGEIIKTATPDKIVGDSKPHEIDFKLPESCKGKRLATFWVQIDGQGCGEPRLLMQRFSLLRYNLVNTRVDADTILKTPPAHDARVGMCNGAMAMMVDGKPITGMGWVSSVIQGVPEAELRDMVGGSGFKCARLVFSLGEQSYISPRWFPSSWRGPDHFDFSYLDTQMRRIMSANPRTRVILEVDLDGAVWWVKMHPEAAGMMADKGIPDYLSPEWVADSRDAIRQMIAHVQTSPYKDAVIGYWIFNGNTLDCNYEINDSTPRAIARFRLWLKDKYKTNAALCAAWKDASASFDTAMPERIDSKEHPKIPNDPMALIVEPASRPRFSDSLAFRNHVYQQVIINFGKAVKEATHGKAIVGARTGNFTGNNNWDWYDAIGEKDPIDELRLSPYFDCFEVQEPYAGRGLKGEHGTGAPILPPQGLAKTNKLIIIQNDWRPHTGPDHGFGATPNVETTIQTQRRVFVNSIANGLYPYLWQMSYHYNDPALRADYTRQEDIFERSLKSDRSTDAEVAFVYDVQYTNFLGYDPIYTAPARSHELFDFCRFTWARAGVPFDMLFLDQIEKARPYKVYVFFHTVGLTKAQRDLISRVTRRNGIVSIFVWADGLIDGDKINPNAMSELTGMKIGMSKQPRTWKMLPSEWFQKKTGAPASTLMGTLPVYEFYDTKGMDRVFSPSFRVNDPKATPLAYYEGSKDVGIAAKWTPKWTTVYSATANLMPSLMRYAAKTAGVFQYTDTEDACYINKSFVGIHSQSKGSVHVRLPAPSPLYDVFSDRELPSGSSFTIPVDVGKTYLYYRGSRAKWQSLGDAQ